MVEFLFVLHTKKPLINQRLFHRWCYPAFLTSAVTKPCFCISNIIAGNILFISISWKFSHNYTCFQYRMEFFASRCLAFRSPLREVLLYALRSDMSFLISLFRVSTTAENNNFPFRPTAAAPILVRPGSSLMKTGSSVWICIP